VEALVKDSFSCQPIQNGSKSNKSDGVVEAEVRNTRKRNFDWRPHPISMRAKLEVEIEEELKKTLDEIFAEESQNPCKEIPIEDERKNYENQDV
jgi:hypothetical protein